MESFLKIFQRKFIADYVAYSVLGSKLFCIILQHIGTKNPFVFVIMHDHGFYGGICDLDGCFSLQGRFPDRETGHSLQKSIEGFLGGNEIAQRIKDQHFVSVLIGHTTIRLQYMGVASDYDIHALLHEKGGPFLLIFRRHGLILFTPVSDKDHTVTVRFGFPDHGGNFGFVKDIDHVFISLTGAAVICAICIIQKSNSDPVYFQGFDRVSVFLGRMDSKDRDIGIFGAPEIKSLSDKIRAVIINMVCSGFDHIKTGTDQGIPHFCRGGKGRVAADGIVIGRKDSFLIYHCHISCCDLISDIIIDMVVIPASGFILTGQQEAVMIKIVSYSNDRRSGNNRGICLFLFFGLFFGSNAFGFLCRLLDHSIVKLPEKHYQYHQNSNRAEKSDP